MTAHATAEEYDAVLVGGSAGSALAALVLAREGRRVLVVEKTDWLGGGTAYSGGIVWVPDNHRMRAKGLDDSAAEGLRYLEAVDPHGGSRAERLSYLTELPDVLALLEASTSLRWVTYPGLPDYWAELPGGRPVGRFLLPRPWEPTPASATLLSHVLPALHAPGHEHEWIWGRAVVGALFDAAARAGAEVRLGTRVVDLVRRPDGGVGGVVVEREGAGRNTIAAGLGVLLNTGGYEWDHTRSDSWFPARLPPQTPPGNTGDGHAMLEKLGAPMRLMDRSILIPGVRVPGADNLGEPLHQVFFQPLAKPHSIVVDATGRRIANEAFFVDLADAMWRAHTDARARGGSAPRFHLVYDEQYRRLCGAPPGVESGLVPVLRASTLPELAALIGCDPATLEAEVAGLNEAVRAGAADAFGRGASAYQRAFADPDAVGNPNVGTLEEGPYSAVEVVLTTAGHRGGVDVDAAASVIGPGGTPVPGLYACGNVVAGTVSGDVYFTGTSLGHCLVLARRAARSMLAGPPNASVERQPQRDA